MDLVPRNCPVCQSNTNAKLIWESNFNEQKLNKHAFASRKTPEFMHFRLSTCKICDVLYSNPAPAIEFLTQNYQEAAYDSDNEANCAAATYNKYLQRVLKELSDRESALDIGTGNGAFLEHLLKAGFKKVQGVEPSAAPVAASKPEIRPLIHQGFFEVSQYQPASFSLISCFQTLEHLYQPDEFCRQIFSLLKPGGACFFVTHNYRAILAKLMGEKSPIIDIEHMQLFSEESLDFLLKKTGFESVKVFSISNEYPLQYWLKLMPFPSPVKKGLSQVFNRTKIGQIAFPIPVGNLACYGFKPF